MKTVIITLMCWVMSTVGSYSTAGDEGLRGRMDDETHNGFVYTPSDTLGDNDIIQDGSRGPFEDLPLADIRPVVTTQDVFDSGEGSCETASLFSAKGVALADGLGALLSYGGWVLYNAGTACVGDDLHESASRYHFYATQGVGLLCLAIPVLWYGITAYALSGPSDSQDDIKAAKNIHNTVAPLHLYQGLATTFGIYQLLFECDASCQMWPFAVIALPLSVCTYVSCVASGLVNLSSLSKSLQER